MNRFVIIIGDTRQMAIKAATCNKRGDSPCPDFPTLPCATCHADGAQKSKRLQTAKIQPELPELIVPPEASRGALEEWERGGGEVG